MVFQSFIENRSETSRKCNCSEDHEIKIINGIFHYSGENHVCAAIALIEHFGQKHIWVSPITGEWPGTGHEDCYVTSHIWTSDSEKMMHIEDSLASPFTSSEIFDFYPVTREQVLAQEGAKEWFIDTYLALFESDKEIGGFLDQHA